MSPPISIGDTSAIITSGARMEKRNFTWRIENFDAVRRSDLEDQRVEFQIGSSIGLPTKILVYLRTTQQPQNGTPGTGSSQPKEAWIGSYYKLIENPGNAVKVIGALSVKLKANNKTIEGSCRDLVKGPWGLACVVKRDGLPKDLPLLKDGSLEMEVEFKLFTDLEPEMKNFSNLKLEKFESKSVKKLSRDFGRILTMGEEDRCDQMAKIISKDSQEFPVNRVVLSARSIVFQRMFQTKMKEAETGILHLEDLSSKTVKVLLRYIYSGTLHGDWKSDDVILELTSAAHKYQLKLLTDFLDNALGSVCNKGNVMKLAILARTLGMRKAEKDLLAFIKANASTLENLTALMADLTTPDENPVSTPSRRTRNFFAIRLGRKKSV